MKSRVAFLSLLFAALACAHTASVGTSPAPTPAIAHVIPAPLAAAPDVPADTSQAGPARNWQLLDEQTDHIAGISSERAMHEFLANKKPKRTIIVAVIDGGVDTAHADLKANLWVNPREIAGNGKDDDNNGHIDDVHGWNFIGGRDGRDVEHDTYEATRVYAGCRHLAPSGDFSAMAPAAQADCVRATAQFNELSKSAKSELANIQQASQVLGAVEKILKDALHTDSLTKEAVANLQTLNADVTRAKAVYGQLAAQGITSAVISKALQEVNSRLKYGIDPEYNPRTIVGDDTLNISQRDYGNADVTGPDASHGTHVAGIIGAVRDNGVGVDGIAPAVKIMAVRAVPDGDERDKDIANAIRYAVDNGANVINMSFGKGFSPGKATVDAAVQYADAHGVLMVHAAGNDAANLDTARSFPTPRYLSGGRPELWIEVGASSWKGGVDLAAEFSNYSQASVDLFAPGVDILSTVPGGKYERDSGTSMASPVVTGVAALVMAYYPELTARDVKQILVNSATRHPNQMVTKPGSTEKVPFGTLSASGGIVNALAALKMAEQVVSKHAIISQ